MIDSQTRVGRGFYDIDTPGVSMEKGDAGNME